MEQQTNLRTLRLRYMSTLSELATASGLSKQYISQAELGETSPTAQLEEKLGTAMDTVIIQRVGRLSALERSYTACKGRLLQATEGDHNE